MIKPAPLPVLVVDDSDDDLALMKSAWREEGVLHPLHCADDGSAAVAYLKGEGAFADRQRFPIPRLLLLDLKMPGMTGFETLTWVRRSAEHRTLPVAILTASLQASDVERCYRLGANSYLVKPSSYGELRALVRVVAAYWLDRNQFPGAAGT